MMVPGFMHTYIEWKETWGMPHIGIVVQVNALRLRESLDMEWTEICENYY